MNKNILPGKIDVTNQPLKPGSIAPNPPLIAMDATRDQSPPWATQAEEALKPKIDPEKYEKGKADRLRRKAKSVLRTIP